LEAEKVIIQLPWGASNTVLGYSSGLIAYNTLGYQAFILSADAPSEYELDQIEAARYVRLNRVASVPQPVNWSATGNLWQASTDIPFCDPILWQELIGAHYKVITAILNRVKVINTEVYLRTNEVVGFDHLIPVYVNKHNAYFYVSEIRNFTDGKLTQVTLIRI
jgi:hypothetical protein